MLMVDIHCIRCCCLTLFWHFFGTYILCFHLILIMKCWWKMNILEVRVVRPISDIFCFVCIFYVSVGSWSCNVYNIPSDWYLCFYGILIMECIYYSLGSVFYVSMVSRSCNVCTIPSDWYFMFLWDPDHVMYVLFPRIGILCFYGILTM
jgi:hypothetical protein